MSETKYVGKRLIRTDSLAKVTGSAKYTGDVWMKRKDMLYAKAKFPPFGRAKIISIDTSKAEKLPGVIAVMTAKDLPGFNGYGGVIPDKPVIAEDMVRYEGDPVALVAAESKKIAEEAIELITVQYERVPAFDEPEDMVSPDAPLFFAEDNPFHKNNISDDQTLKKGDVDKAIEEADVVIDNWYRTPLVDHAYMEPDAAIAEVDPMQGGITIYSPQHAVQLAKRAMSDAFAMPQSKIRVISQVVGGGFGGKEDSTFDVSIIAGVLAIKTQRPVYYEFTRDEVFKNTGKRHPSHIHHILAAKKDGTVTGIKVEAFVDKGAYKSIDAIPSRIVQYAGGPYAIANAYCHSVSVFTDHPYGCAFRGLGSPQAHFAMECQMDELAQRLSMDPVELRRKNMLRDGDTTIWNQPMLEERGLGLEECIDRVTKDEKFNAPLDNSDPYIKRGRGIACFMYGTGTGSITDGAHVMVQVQPDGSVNIGVSASELGQGFIIAMKQIAADTLGVTPDKVFLDYADSATSLEAGATVASRTTTLTGNAIVDGCNKLKERFKKVAAPMVGTGEDNLEFQDNMVFQKGNRNKAVSLSSVIKKAFASQVPLGTIGTWYPPMVYQDKFSQGDKMHAYAFGCQGVEVAVNTLTGEITVEDALLACDIGKAINPDTVEGQMEGGMGMAIGWSIMEEHFMKNGMMKNHTFHDFLIPTTKDLPTLRTIIVEHPNNLGPFGAKGVGEPPIVGMAPAIRNAVKNAVGITLNEIPMTPVRVMEALKKQKS